MTAAKLMGVRVNLQERFQYSPQVARDANASRGLVGWGACTLRGRSENRICGIMIVTMPF